jgi:predicted metal-dependent phosphoesterase TrpH
LKRSVFSSVPNRLAELANRKRADLHIHTTASDGEFTPAQVVGLAGDANLAAIAITDHDTLVGVEAARNAAGDRLEVINGVELSCSLQGREVHLLGYFVRIDHAEFNAALARLCQRRRERFEDYIAKLAEQGIRLEREHVRRVMTSSVSLGRRHLAELLVAGGCARTRTEAFHRFLGPLSGKVIAKRLLPIEEAIPLIRQAGGVSSLAHPSPELVEEGFQLLAGFGLDAIEAEYPWGRRSRTAMLRDTAMRLGLAITGGSDCHGSSQPHRRIGSRGIAWDELFALRRRREERVTCGLQIGFASHPV